jgi:hypothetical protein
MKLTITVFIVAHGLIHLLGYFKAFDVFRLEQFSGGVSKPMGALWLLVALSFITTAATYILDNKNWPIWLLSSAVISQILIFTAWNDAKFGTILNLVFIAIGILSWSEIKFENSFRVDVQESLKSCEISSDLISEEDLIHLPSPVRDYLNYVGVIGKPKVNNFRIVFEGEMREKGKEWFTFDSEQYNFIGDATRLFFMKAKISGVPTTGYHRYAGSEASMLIKLVSLIPVVAVDDEVLFPTETVTFFNDLCLFAPAALIDQRIKWESIDDLSAKATFINKGAVISAALYFNEQGQLVNFVSNDRYAIAEMKTVPFSTPVKDYREINGYRLPTFGEAVWHYPDGKFVYAKLSLKEIEYNVMP